jgi:hypothetical protein
MNHLNLYLKFVDIYINKYYPKINEITSLEEVVVVAYNGYFIFSYTNRGIIAIKIKKRRLFKSGSMVYINDGYVIKGVSGFSNIVGPFLSLTSDEFNEVILEWIYKKHPEITNVDEFYNFCKSNYKRYEDIKHLLS